jgi:hypothetical protein
MLSFVQRVRQCRSLVTAHESLKHYLCKENVERLKPNSWLDIQFPFSMRWAPKGFDLTIDNANSFKLLLTGQRLKLLLQVYDWTRSLRRHSSGMVLAGPYGLGKSAVKKLLLKLSNILQESLLIALYAHANDYALFYCPIAASFRSSPAAYFIHAFRGQNAPLFEKDRELLEKFKVLENESTCEAVITFMKVLSRRDEPVFYIIDEHNEFFIPLVSEKLESYFPYQTPVIEEFVSWNSAVEGNMTFTVYSGSPYSCFLSHLSSEEIHRIRNIGLMTDEEFNTATKEKTSPFYFSDDSRLGLVAGTGLPAGNRGR